MLKDALPYPHTVITPIWAASPSDIFTPSWIVCLLFALGMITFDISSVEEGGDREPPHHRATSSSYKSQQYPPKPPNPLTANEHSCSLDRGDLNPGFVMTLA